MMPFFQPTLKKEGGCPQFDCVRVHKVHFVKKTQLASQIKKKNCNWRKYLFFLIFSQFLLLDRYSVTLPEL